MSKQFNTGEITQFDYTGAFFLTYMKNEDPFTVYDAFFLNETLIPYNVITLLNDYITNSRTSGYYYPMYKTTSAGSGNNRTYGIRILELTSYYSIQYVYYYDSSDITLKRELAQIQKNNIPSTYNIYFLYAYIQTTSEDANRINVVVITESDLFNMIACKVESINDNVRYYGQANFAGRAFHIYEFKKHVGIPFPYAWQQFYADEDRFSYGPPQIITPQNDPLWDYITDGVIDNWYNANGTTPITPEPPEPEIPFDPTEPSDYEPVTQPISDPISVPTSPTYGVTNVGFINVYNPGLNGLTGLGAVLFPNITISSDVADSINNLVTVLMNQNLINYVIDCHILPCAPQVGNSEEIKVGFRDTGIMAPRVTSDYVRYTCGTISLAETFNSFADYIGTKAKLYLPFIGFVDMLPEYWQAGVLGVEYCFNIIDGSCMAYIVSTSSKSALNGSVIAQFAGNACMHLPITGVNYANMVSGIIGAATTIATSGSAASAFGGAASAINAFIAGGNVQQSNGYNSTAAILGVRTPYMIIERISPAYPANYAHDKGYPSTISTYLTYVSGFTIISDIDLSGIPFTSNELSELRILLNEGVYF